ncbi:MAG TPA: outer membrane beta-barrel protein [Verrucomicrobiae bacterium]|nr:outer membrane beta-barrel protein [Verrucomicrobiae bacterium]
MNKKMLVLAIFLIGLPAIPALGQNNRHHIGLVLGYAKLIDDDVKPLGYDFSNSGHAALTYRYSVTPNIDLAVEARGTASTQEVSGNDLNLLNSYFGPGVRVVAPQNNLKLFLQGNFYFVSEEVETVSGNTTTTVSEDGVGFGVNGGVDIRLGRLLSLPIEVNFLYAKPSDNISGFGLSAGLNFNFGMMP